MKMLTGGRWVTLRSTHPTFSGILFLGKFIMPADISDNINISESPASQAQVQV